MSHEIYSIIVLGAANLLLIIVCIWATVKNRRLKRDQLNMMAAYTAATDLNRQYSRALNEMKLSKEQQEILQKRILKNFDEMLDVLTEYK